MKRLFIDLMKKRKLRLFYLFLCCLAVFSSSAVVVHMYDVNTAHIYDVNGIVTLIAPIEMLFWRFL